MRAAIIGAGIGGLTAAIALKKAGWNVEIFEQAEKLVPIGAALSLWPNAVSALDMIGCGDALRKVAQPIENFGIAEANGKKIAQFSIEKVIAGSSAFLPTRTELQNLLLAAAADIPLHLDEKFTDHHQDVNGVTIKFESGREEKADILIAADGIWSKIAQDVNGDQPAHTGYGGILALSDPVTNLSEMRGGTEYWGNGERMGVFDLKGGSKYWFYMKNENSPEETAAIDRDFIASRMEGWSEHAVAAVAATPADRLIPFSIHAKPKPRKIVNGRVILVGDAAHAMEPNMGQGACQAIEDGVALGIAAQISDMATLGKRYEKLRLKRAREFVKLSRQGSLLVHRMPKWFMPIAKTVMRVGFQAVAGIQLKKLYRFPLDRKL